MPWKMRWYHHHFDRRQVRRLDGQCLEPWVRKYRQGLMTLVGKGHDQGQCHSMLESHCAFALIGLDFSDGQGFLFDLPFIPGRPGVPGYPMRPLGPGSPISPGCPFGPGIPWSPEDDREVLQTPRWHMSYINWEGHLCSYYRRYLNQEHCFITFSS